ncbi:MAG: DUF4403 family protein [Saprospiraceae bacterium]|nr:DUF4403 family protein [Saprospiraceae bacterium]
MSKSIWSFLFLAALLGSCKTKQPVRPDEYYENLSLEPEPSTINIPIRLYKNDLLKGITGELGSVLYEDKNLADDGMMMKVTRRDGLTLNVDSQEITYTVPMDLWVKKDVAISTVEAEGSLSLDFITQFHIKNDWSLETKTTVSGYHWLREPVVKLGFANLPVTSIANVFINQTKQDFAATIDQEVNDMLDLKKEIENVWQEINQPFLISEEYATWLVLNPQSISMTPFTTKGDRIEGILSVVTRPTVFLGEKPPARPIGKIPAFQQGQSDGEDFTLFLSTEIPFKEAERLTKENMIGETFSYANKHVKVEDVELYGQGNKLVINTQLSGDYNGNVYFTGKPEYNARKNRIEMTNVDFDFTSKKALMKSASWLFKGTLKKKVQESLDFYLRENLDETKNAIQQEFENYELAPGISMKANLNELNVSHVYIATEGIRVRIGMNGNLNVDVKGLGK